MTASVLSCMAAILSKLSQIVDEQTVVHANTGNVSSNVIPWWNSLRSGQTFCSSQRVSSLNYSAADIAIVCMHPRRLHLTVVTVVCSCGPMFACITDVRM